MSENYLELRNRNSFGDIINTYFQFLKYNFKNYTSLYLKYNAISIILALICAYLLVTGFMGLASRDFRFGMEGTLDNESYLISGVVIFFLIVFSTTLVNYSFSSSYLAEYVERRGEINPQSIWKRIRNNIGTIIIFVLLGILLYIGYLILSVVFAFIPVAGMIAQYGLGFLISAIFGLSFMSIFSKNKSAAEAFSEAWDLGLSSFWKVILFGMVIGILNLMITSLIVSFPTFIIGIYTYFSIQTEVEILSSVFASIVYTIGLAMFILAFIYTQALSQIAYGILYFNLHEERYNLFLRERIEKIGSHA